MPVAGEICNKPLFVDVINVYLESRECMMKCVLRERPRRRVFLVLGQMRRLLWNVNCLNHIYNIRSSPRTLSQIVTLVCHPFLAVLDCCQYIRSCHSQDLVRHPLAGWTKGLGCKESEIPHGDRESTHS